MDRDEALRLLTGGGDGVDEWNRRREAGEEIPDLSKADLVGANLYRVNLAGARLAGARLDGTRLDRASLDEANLAGARLDRAGLIGARVAGARLERAGLVGARLVQARLDGAGLVGANLNGARLVRASLVGAILDGARLTGASLVGARLTGARLHRANLTGARLHRASFNGARLSGARLAGAICEDTVFADVDLSQVKGLDVVKHQGPSTLGIDTLIRSKGKIPEAFLRGCGVPDAWIAGLPSLIGAMEPIQFYSCFISYSTQDEEFAQRLHSRMVQEKLRVWFAPDDMRGGRKVVDQLEGVIYVLDKLLLVLSQASMQSGWVETGLRTALQREQSEKRHILFPIRITSWEPVRDWQCFDCDTGRDLAQVVREYHIPDFTNWKDHDAFEASFAHLLRDLKAEDSTAMREAIRSRSGRT